MILKSQVNNIGNAGTKGVIIPNYQFIFYFRNEKSQRCSFSVDSLRIILLSPNFILRKKMLTCAVFFLYFLIKSQMGLDYSTEKIIKIE